MNVAILGTGYVGLTTGACLAYLGHQVTCVDPDANKIGALQRGEVPFHEPHLDDLLEQARAFLVERIGREMAVSRQQALLSTLVERESFVQRGFDFQEAELAAARAKQSEKARAGNLGAQKELARIKEQQRLLFQRRQERRARS